MGSICIGVILIFLSVFVALRIRSLLVGRSADPDIRDVINEVLAEQEEIDCVFKTITMQFGPDTMVATKVRLVFVSRGLKPSGGTKS